MKKMDLSKYRLNLELLISKYVDPDPYRYSEFEKKVYACLNAIPEGGTFYIPDHVKEEFYEVFIMTVCSYINEKRMISTKEDSYIEFYDEDYNIIKKIEHS